MRIVTSRILPKKKSITTLFFYLIMKEKKNTPQPLTAEKGMVCITDSGIQQAAISPLCVIQQLEPGIANTSTCLCSSLIQVEQQTHSF